MKFSFLIIYSLLLSILTPIYLPNLHIATFAGLLTIIYTNRSYPLSLWISLFIGFYFDLMASKLPLGFYSLSYCLAVTIVYSYRRFFLLEKWWIFPLYSAIFSFASTLVQIILLAIFNAKIPIRFSMIISDLGIMPLVDALFTLCFFTFPYAFFNYLTNPSRIHYFKVVMKKYRMRLIEWKIQLRSKKSISQN